jgi:hypothetical protein
MNRYRVVWCQCPTSYHDNKVLFVEAATPDNARNLVRDHVERTLGIEWFTVGTPTLHSAVPESLGRVIGSSDDDGRDHLSRYSPRMRTDL